MQTHDKIGLTFSQVLRTSLRQDPDVLLVGEMRDLETVEIGLRASMTGHLVLSTLHTNSAISTITRLMDIGASGYLLASSLLGIIAQRLVRKICQNCATPATLNMQQKSWLEGRGITEHQGFTTGKGCERCNQTGYRGRTGIYQLLEINAAMAAALRVDDLPEFITAVNASGSHATLANLVIQSALEGVTSLDEAIRIGSDEEI